MMYFYVVENIDYCTPAWVADDDCCYVKGSSDRTMSAIISKTEIDYISVSQQEMQTTLDSWIDAENSVAEFDEILGRFLTQEKINLESIINWYGAS
jgi:hypothetical protein